MSSRQKRWLVLTVVAAAALRLWCFIGYARGDDPLYVMIPKRILDEGLHFFTPQTFAYGVNYRMGLYIPIAASFALLGVNDFAFVLCYLLVPALAYVVVRTPRRAAIVLLWLVLLALLLEFMPMRFHPLVLSPRYVRYLNGLLAPAALVVAIPLGALWRRSRFLVGGILTGIAAASIHDARAQQRAWLDGTSDARYASRLLWQLPPKPVFSDGWFCDRYRFDGGLDLRRLVGRDCTDEIRGHKFTWLVAQGKTDQLASLPPGYVVAGGSRVHYALVSSVLQLDDGMIPPGWRLVRELPSTPAPYRPQPIRIWEIGGSSRPADGSGAGG